MALTNEAARWVTAGVASLAVGIYYAYQNQLGLPDLGYSPIPGCNSGYYGNVMNLYGIAKLSALLVGGASALNLFKLELTDRIIERPNCSTPAAPPAGTPPPTPRP